MNIFEELEKLKIKHYSCEDRWYSCPLSEDGTFNEFIDQEKCNCVAEYHNKKVDELISYIRKNYKENNNDNTN